MNIKLFIDRPILSCCISVLLVLLGIIGIYALPVEQYPDIAPPTVSVSATYSGASASTVQRSVIVPLEEAINGVENMLYMTSTASNSGSASIKVYFKQGTDADMAAVNVQNRVSKVQAKLPSTVTKTGVTTQKSQSGQLKILSLYSDSKNYDETFCANYFKINIAPQFQRVTGVGDVTVLGNDYAMRIWLDPQKMSQYKLVPSDISTVLSQQNLEAATGTLGEDSDNTFLYSLKYRGRYETVDEFGALVIKSLPDGNILRLKDIANIELGSQSYSYTNGVEGHPGTTAMITQTAGSNANEILNDINELEEQIKAELPEGLHIVDLYSVQDFLDASIREVLKTLIEAIMLVVLVVYVFLQSVRSTIIPTISILVSLIATFAFIYVAGFSINLLTLFALILVIGTVVDDAIVVVEAVQAKFEEGYKSSYKATVDAMGGIASAIFTTSLVFMSVFVPVCFIGGTSGTFYTQFGVTMAVAVGISAVNALTLGPALCSVFMRPANYDDPKNQRGFTYRFHVAFDTAFKALTFKYRQVLMVLFRRKWITLLILVCSAAALVFMMKTTKTGLIPDEDTGVVFAAVTTSPGYTLNQTQKTMDEVEKLIADIPQIDTYTKITGFNLMGGGASASGGTFIIRLKNWDDRPGTENSNTAVISEIFRRTAGIKTASVYAFAPPMITGYGASNGLSLSVQDKQGGTVDDLYDVTSKFIAALNQRPEIQLAMTTFDPRFPQFKVEVDAARCIRLGVSPSDVLDVMSAFIGGSYASDIDLYSKQYRVIMQSITDQRRDEGALTNMFVRNSAGEMIPLEQFVTLTRIYGSESIGRFNMFTSIDVSASVADGYSSGEAIKAVAAVANESLPTGYGYEYSGLSRDEASQGNSAVMVYGICLVFIFIILASLYESLLIPFAVMLSIPTALLGAFIGAKILGVENNIYMQTGLIMLIGLISKTAILVTEQASTFRRSGMSISQAAMAAARVRLRPILMTSVTMVVGLMPLVAATGVGANGNRSLGVGVVFGMLIGIIGLLMITPVLFIVLQSIQERFSLKQKLENEEGDPR